MAYKVIKALGEKCFYPQLGDVLTELLPFAAMATICDVMELKELGLGVSSINLSCGYYSPHTGNEFIVKKDLLNCLNFVRHIIETCTKIYHHTCEDWYGRSRFGKEYEYWEQYNEVSIIMAVSKILCK